MIIIPMAGLSRRFTEAGYSVPKYMLPLHGASVFTHAINSFTAYFKTMPFLFIARSDRGVAEFLTAECARLGILDIHVAILASTTSGQAETVEQGLRAANVNDETPVTIFNIDTFRRDFIFPAEDWFQWSDGYLEVFEGCGANWSYVRPSPDKDNRVIETAEKRPLSNLCCTGLYHFARSADFLAALELERQARSAPELYVAPIYNHLVARGHRVHYKVIPSSDVVFCGTPVEYEMLCSQPQTDG